MKVFCQMTWMVQTYCLLFTLFTPWLLLPLVSDKLSVFCIVLYLYVSTSQSSWFVFGKLESNSCSIRTWSIMSSQWCKAQCYVKVKDIKSSNTSLKVVIFEDKFYSCSKIIPTKHPPHPLPMFSCFFVVISFMKSNPGKDIMLAVFFFIR